jgi:hypothetical protein
MVPNKFILFFVLYHKVFCNFQFIWKDFQDEMLIKLTMTYSSVGTVFKQQINKPSILSELAESQVS